MRTHTCGELRKKDVTKTVVLEGWAQSRRDHGGVIFIDLRDRYGMSQVVLTRRTIIQFTRQQSILEGSLFCM